MKKHLGLLWATIALVGAIGIFGLFAWDGDPIAWCAWSGVAVTVTVAALYTRHQTIPSNANPNNHYPDICENCRPVQMRDGGPIKVMSWWYAAVNGLTREDAMERLGNMSVQDHAKVTDNHMRYLQQFPNS